MRTTLTALLYLLIALPLFSQSSPKYSLTQVQEDLDFLYHSLRDAQFAPFTEVTEEDFKQKYNDLRSSVQQDSFTLLEATNLLQPLVSMLDNGHTNIGFPVTSYLEYAESGGTLFPVEIALENGKALVRRNLSKNRNIRIGSQVHAINGVPIEEILDKIYPHISAERPYLKNAKIEFFSFPRYYWQVFGEQEKFSVSLVQGEALITTWVSAISIDEFSSGRTEVFNARRNLDIRGNLAILNPGNLFGEAEIYQPFFDSVFQDLNSRKTEILVIDLRNNQGGDNSYSDYLLSYLADKPFTWNSSFTLKTSAFLKEHVRQHMDTTSRFWREALDRKNGEVYDYKFPAYEPQPASKRFRGDVYVLVNRQSHSQATVTAAQIQDYGFGTIVGEETGDFPSLTASVFNYYLPNTSIRVMVAKGAMVRVNGSKKKEGVIPDLLIRDHLLDEKDEIMEGLLRRLGKKL
jgi:hypothetical protein